MNRGRNFSAINTHINTGNSGLVCGLQNSQVVVIGDGEARLTAVHLHELGQLFDPGHTQNCACGCCEWGGGACAHSLLAKWEWHSHGILAKSLGHSRSYIRSRSR